MNNYIYKMDNSSQILLYLAKNQHKKFSMLELSKLLKIPYASFHRTIKKLKNQLITEHIGQTKAITINSKNQLNLAYLTIAATKETEEYLEKKPIIKTIAREIKTKDVVILFGSYAKNEERKKSDIDIIIINKKGERSMSFSKHELLLDKEINSLFFTEKEFKLMLKDKEENVGKQALKNHIILNNQKRFWEIVYNEL